MGGVGDTSDNLIFTKRVWVGMNINVQYRMKGKLILMYSYSTVLVHFMYSKRVTCYTSNTQLEEKLTPPERDQVLIFSY